MRIQLARGEPRLLAPGFFHEIGLQRRLALDLAAGKMTDAIGGEEIRHVGPQAGCLVLRIGMLQPLDGVHGFLGLHTCLKLCQLLIH